MTDAPLPREEAERLLALCEAATAGEWRVSITDAVRVYAAEDQQICLMSWRASQGQLGGAEVEANAKVIADARTALPRVLHEVLRLQRNLAKAREYAETMGIRHQRLREVELEPTQAELAAWRKLQPDLDRLAALVGTCEGASPLGAAVAEIERLRAELAAHDCDAETQEFRLQNDREWREKLDHAKAEAARLRRALDAAGIVLGSDG